MITKPKSTKCRICGKPPYKGARCKECFNQSHKEQQAARRANSGKKCACGQPMGAQAKRCRRCNGLDMAAHQQPRVYQKPPDEYKMKHMTKAEKQAVEVLPVTDTKAEKEKRDALLAKAQAERMAVPAQSRWERGSLWD
jgi:hypothetical protein